MRLHKLPEIALPCLLHVQCLMTWLLNRQKSKVPCTCRMQPGILSQLRYRNRRGRGPQLRDRWDAESVALQKPETQQAVKQVQVDAESAQLQKPETQQVTHLGLPAPFDAAASI